jgi:hypothetical protein
MKRYGIHAGIPLPEFDKHTHAQDMSAYYDLVGVEIQRDWKGFLTFYGTIKDEYFRKAKHGKPKWYKYDKTYTKRMKEFIAYNDGNMI